MFWGASSFEEAFTQISEYLGNPKHRQQFNKGKSLMADILQEYELNQFTGTEYWYKHPLYRKYCYTDGVKFLAEKGGAFWLIDDILMYQNMNENLRNESFCVWSLTLNDKGGAVLTCEDGNLSFLFSTEITYTDFPLKQIKLYCIDNVLLLTSEY